MDDEYPYRVLDIDLITFKNGINDFLNYHMELVIVGINNHEPEQSIE